LQLLCLSISYHNTPVELRECISLSEEAIFDAFSSHPIHQGDYSAINEMVIISTCNRVELYTSINLPAGLEGDSKTADEPLLAYMSQELGLPTLLVEPYIKSFTGIQAVDHLFRVTSGLDSVAIGESQILGQVSRALEVALRSGSARHVLPSLFQAAVHLGKRVHTETEIGRRPTSISSVAVELAEDVMGSLAGKTILVIGAGKMGGLVLEALSARHVHHTILMNRTFDHAAEMAERFRVSTNPFEQLFERLVQTDLVFTATSSPRSIIHRDLIARVMAQRKQRPLFLIDLSVPRNVGVDAGEIQNVHLYDMDDIQSFARNLQPSRYPDISRAEALVAEQVLEYDRLLQVVPVIGELHKKAEEIRRREVERTLRHLPALDPATCEQIELLSRSLVKKILHEPTMHLRTEANRDTLKDYADTLSRLFDLQAEEPDSELREEEGMALK
jgi:glutamyl-tRNA reductase